MNPLILLSFHNWSFFACLWLNKLFSSPEEVQFIHLPEWHFLFQICFILFTGERTVTYSDRTAMPYTNAVCTEIQRFRNVALGTLMHFTSKDVSVLGVSIPKGGININTYQISPWICIIQCNTFTFISKVALALYLSSKSWWLTTCKTSWGPRNYTLWLYLLIQS